MFLCEQILIGPCEDDECSEKKTMRTLIEDNTDKIQVGGMTKCKDAESLDCVTMKSLVTNALKERLSTAFQNGEKKKSSQKESLWGLVRRGEEGFNTTEVEEAKARWQGKAALTEAMAGFLS